MNYALYKNRLIAFLDILGFKKQLEINDLNSLHSTYAALIDEANSKIFQANTIPGSQVPYEVNFEKATFLFDSIVLVSKPTEDIQNIGKFILSISLLMDKAHSQGMPLRGGITYGDFLDDKERDIFLSREFADLVKIEQQQEWAGCILLHKAESLVLKAIFGTAPSEIRSSQPLIPFRVPFKKEEDSNIYWCINWSHLMDENLILPFIDGLISPKKEYTEEFVKHARALPDDSQTLSQEFYPAVKFKILKARSGCQFKFFDKTGKGVRPGCAEWTFAIYE
jgi:hypothetical protein